MLTLNQDIEIFKQFQVKHKALNAFYFGDESEAIASTAPVYPFMTVVLQGSGITGDVVARRYLVIISDLVNVDESNETHVLSDTELICYDLVNYLQQVSKSGLLSTFKATKDISLTDFTERTDDSVSGHFFEITLSSHIGNYSCNLPIASGNIMDNTYIYAGGSIISSNFLVEIKDQDGNVLQSFTTSGEYMVNILTGIQQVIGNTTPTIIQDILP